MLKQREETWKKNVEGCTEKREENNSERGKMSGTEKLWGRHMHRGVVIGGDASGLEEGKKKKARKKKQHHDYD